MRKARVVERGRRRGKGIERREVGSRVRMEVSGLGGVGDASCERGDDMIASASGGCGSVDVHKWIGYLQWIERGTLTRWSTQIGSCGFRLACPFA